MASWDDFDPAKDDFNSLGNSIIKNGPAKNHIRMNSDRISVYIQNVPLSLDEVAFERIIKSVVPDVVSVKKHPAIGKPTTVATVNVKTAIDMEKLISTLDNQPPHHLKLSKGLTQEEKQLRNRANSMNDYAMSRGYRPQNPYGGDPLNTNGPNNPPKQRPTFQNTRHMGKPLSTDNPFNPTVQNFPVRPTLHQPRATNAPTEQKETSMKSPPFESNLWASKETPEEPTAALALAPAPAPQTNGHEVEQGSAPGGGHHHQVDLNSVREENASTSKEKLLTGRRKCNFCSQPDCTLKCSVCKFFYCSDDCRDEDWPEHQKICRAPPPLLSCASSSHKVTEDTKKEDQRQPITTPEKEAGFVSPPSCRPTPKHSFAGEQAPKSPMEKKPYTNHSRQPVHSKQPVANPPQINHNQKKPMRNSVSKQVGTSPQNIKMDSNSVPQIKNEALPSSSSTQKGGFPMSDGYKLLQEGLAYKALITVVNKNNFKLMISGEKFDVNVESLYPSETDKSLNMSEIHAGQFVCALSSTYGSWHRAYVIEKVESKSSIKVCFIDYGNVEEAVQVKTLEPKYSSAHYPGHSFYCDIKENTSKFDELYVESVITLGVTKIEEGNVHAKLLGKNRVELELVLQPWCTPLLSLPRKPSMPENDKIVELQKSFLQGQKSNKTKAAPINIQVQVEPIKSFQSCQLKKEELQANKTYRVSVVWVNVEDEKFYLQLQHQQSSLDMMKQAANEFAKNAPIASKFDKGDLLLGISKFDESVWLRMEVLEATEAGIQVASVDYGTEETLARDNLRVFDESLLNYKIMAHEVTFADNNISEEDVEMLNEYSMDMSKLEMFVISLNPLKVSLKDSDTIIPKQQEPPKTNLRKPKQPAQPVSSEYVPKTILASESSSLTLKVAEKQEVSFITIESTERLYAIPQELKEEYDEKLSTLSEEMNKYCNAKENHYYEPRQNEICLAKYSEDEQWYRATCLVKEPSKESAVVTFVDFGNTEVTEFTSLCKMVTEFMRLPLVAIQCYIEGVPSGTELDDRIKELVSLDVPHTIRVLGKNADENVYAIKIEGLDL